LGNKKLRPTRATGLLDGVAMPPMLVQGLIPKGGLVMVSAEPYVGKTFMSLELARSVATGTPFLGKFPTNMGNVLFVEEDAPAWDLSAQLIKLTGHQNDLDRQQLLGDVDPLTDLEKHLYFLVGQGVTLDTTNDALALAHAMEEVGDPSSGMEGTDLLILDTMRSMHSAEENDATQMAHLLEKLRLIQRSTGACIVLLHHFNKPTKENAGSLSYRLRGSTAILGALDGLIGLTKVNKEGLVRAQILKSRAIQTEGFEFWIAPTEHGTGLIYNDTKADLSGRIREQVIQGGDFRMEDFFATARQVFPLKQENALRNMIQRALSLLEAQGVLKKTKRGEWHADIKN